MCRLRFSECQCVSFGARWLSPARFIVLGRARIGMSVSEVRLFADQVAARVYGTAAAEGPSGCQFRSPQKTLGAVFARTKQWRRERPGARWGRGALSVPALRAGPAPGRPAGSFTLPRRQGRPRTTRRAAHPLKTYLLALNALLIPRAKGCGRHRVPAIAPPQHRHSSSLPR